MLTSLDPSGWRPHQVRDWLKGLFDESSWLNEDFIVDNNISGRELMMLTASDLYEFGASKVDLQENILNAIDKLRYSSSSFKSNETLQIAILRLAVEARSLQKQLVANRVRALNEHTLVISKISSPTRDSIRRESNPRIQKQRVELDTLVCVSTIVRIAQHVTKIISQKPFTKYDDYRSMKSLILALSIELTSTAQRDQFVDQPNDIIEKSSKALADYCERIVHGTKDVLLIEPFQIKTLRLRRKDNESDFGFSIQSIADGRHTVERVAPLSTAKRNDLSVGDEVIYFNEFIIGWSPNKVKQLVANCSELVEVMLMVIKDPNE